MPKGWSSCVSFCIGFDAQITGDTDNFTRARLYHAITRAQLQAIVVDRFVRGGWLEFLNALKLKETTFQADDAKLEIKKDAALKIVEDSRRETVPGKPTKQENCFFAWNLWRASNCVDDIVAKMAMPFWLKLFPCDPNTPKTFRSSILPMASSSPVASETGTVGSFSLIGTEMDTGADYMLLSTTETEAAPAEVCDRFLSVIQTSQRRPLLRSSRRWRR